MNSGVVLFGGLTAATAGLGFWQLQRYYWKVDLIKTNEELFHLPVEKIQDSDISNSLSLSKKFDSMKGKRISIQGKFDHSQEMLLGPRTAPGLVTKKAQGMASNPQGFFVITPLYFNNGTRVFVNRGWIPKNCTEWSHPDGIQTTVGIVQDWEKKSSFTPENDIKSGKLISLDGNSLIRSSEMRSQTSSPALCEEKEIPLLMERLEDSPDKVALLKENEKYPLSRNMNFLDNNYVTPEVHFAYSVTWFSLAIAAAVITRYASKSKRQMWRMPLSKPQK